MILVEQFQNLLDPSTALGAFLISLLAGIVPSFLLGMKFQKKLIRKIVLRLKKWNQLFRIFIKKGFQMQWMKK